MIAEVGQAGKPAEYVKQFGVAFFMVSWVWGQLLRIVYQNWQRDRLEGLGRKLEAASGAVNRLQIIAANILARVTPETQTEIRHLVSAARSVERNLTDAHSAYNELEVREARRKLSGDPRTFEARRAKDLTGPL